MLAAVGSPVEYKISVLYKTIRIENQERKLEGKFLINKKSTTYDVILYMLTDAWKSHLNGNSGSLKNILGANSTQHQNLRSADCTAGQQDFLGDVYGQHRGARSTSILDGDSSQISRRVACEDNIRDGSIWEDGKVGAGRERVDIGRTGV